jgi:hypothetical protein
MNTTLKTIYTVVSLNRVTGLKCVLWAHRTLEGAKLAISHMEHNSRETHRYTIEPLGLEE